MLALLPLLSKALPFLTGLNFNWVGGFLSGLFKNIQANWKVWLISLLVLLQVGTAYGFHHEHDLLVNEIANHKSDTAKFTEEQKTADAQAQAEKNKLQIESKAAQNVADTNYGALLTKFNASLLRYKTASSKSGTGQTLDNQLSTTQSPNGPGQDTDLPSSLTITGSDAEICAVNTARLQAAHDWALEQEKMVNEATSSKTNSVQGP